MSKKTNKATYSIMVTRIRFENSKCHKNEQKKNDQRQLMRSPVNNRSNIRPVYSFFMIFVVVTGFGSVEIRFLFFLFYCHSNEYWPQSNISAHSNGLPFGIVMCAAKEIYFIGRKLDGYLNIATTFSETESATLPSSSQ